MLASKRETTDTIPYTTNKNRIIFLNLNPFLKLTRIPLTQIEPGGFVAQSGEHCTVWQLSWV